MCLCDLSFFSAWTGLGMSPCMSVYLSVCLDGDCNMLGRLNDRAFSLQQVIMLFYRCECPAADWQSERVFTWWRQRLRHAHWRWLFFTWIIPVQWRQRVERNSTLTHILLFVSNIKSTLVRCAYSRPGTSSVITIYSPCYLIYRDKVEVVHTYRLWFCRCFFLA